MNVDLNVPLFRAAFLLFVPLAANLASTSAFAQESTTGPANKDNAVGDGGASPPAPPAATAADAPVAAPAEPPAQTLGPIERLPASAYPSAPVRGLYGGSLWRVFHGMQWPYYPKTGIGISGDVWLDPAFRHVTTDEPNVVGRQEMIQQGRFVLRVTPTWTMNGGYFVQGQAELVANKDQTQGQPYNVDTDDVWLRVGRWGSWDVQVGRFEAWEVYHRGMGLDIHSFEYDGAAVFGTPLPIYGLTYAFFRANGVGQGAIHVYPTQNLRFELGSEFGNDQGQNTLAARPVAIYDIGWLKLKGGAEYVASADTNDGGKGSKTQRGVGGAVQFVIDPYIEFGGNAAYGLVDAYKSTDGSYDETTSDTNYSVGGFVNARPFGTLGLPDLLIGGGYDYTYLEDQHYEGAPLNRNGKYRHTQTFVAVQYYLWKQLFIKAVGGYAKGEFAPTFNDPSYFTSEMVSGRVRIEYLF